jgi:hypothetical protein
MLKLGRPAKQACPNNPENVTFIREHVTELANTDRSCKAVPCARLRPLSREKA